MKYVDSDGVEHEIVQPKLTRNYTLKAIKITGNYLKQQKSGMLCWAWPNNDFKVRHKTGNDLEVIANLRYDDTPHSADLFVYTTVRKHEGPEDIIQENRVHLKRSRKWYVRQFIQIDRAGLTRFGRLPLREFLKIWRQPLDPARLYLRGHAGPYSSQVKFATTSSTDPDFGKTYPLALSWDELGNDRGTRIGEQSQDVLPWLAKHCRGRIYPFSDYATMFELPRDEFCYLTDLACR